MRFLIPLTLAARVVFAQSQGLPPVTIYQPPPVTPQQQSQQNQAQQNQQPTPLSTQPGRLADTKGFMMGDVPLNEMIKLIAERLKINILIDQKVKGNVTVYTYGEVKEVELMPLLETLLRVNGAAMVKVGEIYRIVPIGMVPNLPMEPVVNLEQSTLPSDERMVLNLIFLKYATATEMDKLLQPFYGEGAKSTVYEPANLLILQDNARNMKRTMDLLRLFDADTFAGQRVRLFEVENSRPSDLVKELESVFKAYALSEKSMAVKFLPVDRINTLIVVAPNPGIFPQVAEWIQKLDIAVKTAAGSINNYVYRLKYGRSETLAMAIMALYSGNPMAMMGLASMLGNQGMTGVTGAGGAGGGMMGGGMMGGGYGMGMGYPGMGYGMGMGMGMGYPGMGYGYGGMGVQQQPGMTSSTTGVPNTNQGLTGQYMGLPGAGFSQPQQRMPHVIPNPFDNTLLVQCTPQEWEQIYDLLQQLDIPPRQVLIDAKIYELQLGGAFSAGVQAYLDKKGLGPFSRSLKSEFASTGLELSTGLLVKRSHELLLAVTAAESQNQSRVIASPSIIATDSVPATMNVGQDVPVLTSQAVGGVQQGGSSLFTNTISSRSTGTQLNVLARINSSGVVTLVIDQDVSGAAPNSTSNINSPEFSRRSFQTQVTVQDGETIAIGGFIQETKTYSSSGVPILHRIPVLGNAFGSKSTSKARTELVIFLTPRVIYDTNQIQDASDEIKGRLRKLSKHIQNDPDK